MPRVLLRYIFFDLLRIIGLTTLVLVTVIAFGATIKPLAGDKLLSLGQTLRYLWLAVIPMLQYALPFAAGFGVTLTFQRMTAENEIQAMAASGIAYRHILRPVLLLGIMLTLFMVVLTQWVIPRFVSTMERMITTDVTNMFAAAIRRHEPFRFGDLQIYADDIVVIENPLQEGGPDMRMILMNVAAAELDDASRIKKEVTAQEAVIDVYRRDNRTYLKLAMRNTVVYEAAEGTLGQLERVMPRPIVIAGGLRDHPKAMTQSQLLSLRKNPDDFAHVNEAKISLAEAIRDGGARSAIDAMLRTQGRFELHGDSSQEQRSFIVHADRMQESQVISDRNGFIEVHQIDGGVPSLRMVAQKAVLESARVDVLSTEVRFNFHLKQVEVSDMRRDAAPNSKANLVLNNLGAALPSEHELHSLSSDELIERAQQTAEQNLRVKSNLDVLHERLLRLNRQIVSYLLNRYALSITAILLLALGAVLAMVLRGSLPLAIYMWAFFPAIADLVLISAGTQLVRDGHSIGHVLMWSGNAIIVVMIIAAYRRLVRN